MGIHGDPVKTRRQIDRARKSGEDLGADPYGYERAFKYVPSQSDQDWVASNTGIASASSIWVLDPTAGGGSIPFEAGRLGFSALANDLNPVAALILKATLDYPPTFGGEVLNEYKRLSAAFLSRVTPKFNGIFPAEHNNAQVLAYLWARTISCPYCDGIIPLSPNWRIAGDGTGVRLHPARNVSTTLIHSGLEFKLVS